jgi:hypothetical protein
VCARALCSIAVPEPIPIQRMGEHGSIPASDAVNCHPFVIDILQLLTGTTGTINFKRIQLLKAAILIFSPLENLKYIVFQFMQDPPLTRAIRCHVMSPQPTLTVC